MWCPHLKGSYGAISGAKKPTEGHRTHLVFVRKSIWTIERVVSLVERVVAFLMARVFVRCGSCSVSLVSAAINGHASFARQHTCFYFRLRPIVNRCTALLSLHFHVFHVLTVSAASARHKSSLCARRLPVTVCITFPFPFKCDISSAIYYAHLFPFFFCRGAKKQRFSGNQCHENSTNC